MNKIKILVATHKKIDMRSFGECYSLIQVGAALHDKLEYLHDDEGVNISEKNSIYCELTALYWGWKNIISEYKGLCHYRRYLAKHYYSFNDIKNVYSEKELLKILDNYDIIVPKKKYRSLNNSWYPTLEELERDRSYCVIKEAVLQVCPEYLSTVNSVFLSKKMFFCNVMIAKTEIYDNYCDWLFKLEKVIEGILNRKDGIRPREMGFLSEWLLDVWVEYNLSDLKVKYTPLARIDRPKNLKNVACVFLERTRLLYILEKLKYEKIYKKSKRVLGK